jgi:hypothetical protein
MRRIMIMRVIAFASFLVLMAPSAVAHGCSYWELASDCDSG